VRCRYATTSADDAVRCDPIKPLGRCLVENGFLAGKCQYLKCRPVRDRRRDSERLVKGRLVTWVDINLG
jgi:hypothetical protein